MTENVGMHPISHYGGPYFVSLQSPSLYNGVFFLEHRIYPKEPRRLINYCTVARKPANQQAEG